MNPVEVFGFLVSDSGLKIKYGVMKGDINTGTTSQLRIDYQSTPATPIDTGTSVDAEFTDLYAATNKLSFAALTDTLFVAQGANVYSASFAFNPSSTIQKLTITAPPPPAPAPAAGTFTGITAIDVLKFTDTDGDKFYLAVGDPGSDTSAGKVGVFEGTDSGFSDIEQTFRVEGDIGEWFGWSVKLQKLSSDPVLFVGAPKATIGSTSGVGYVKVFTVVAGSAGEAGSAIQTITPPAFSTSYVRAFGYSLAGGIHSSDNYLIVGAPASTHNSAQEGAAFVYAWNGSTAYDLKAIARPTAGSYGIVPAGVETAVIYPSTPWNFAHNSNFGASVGYLLHQTRPYFYFVSYNSGHTETAMTAFGRVVGITYYNSGRSRVATGEYGALFTLPVVHSTQTYTILGFLVLDGGNLKIKYGVVSHTAGGVDFQGTGIPIPTGTGITAVADGFTNLYATNKLSFAALTDKLFIAQGTGVYNTSLAASGTSFSAFLTAVNLSIGTIAELTLTAAQIGSEIGQEAVTFTGITAIDVLKFTDTDGDKFYLAVGDPTG